MPKGPQGQKRPAEGIFPLPSALGFEGHIHFEALWDSRFTPKLFNGFANLEEFLNVGWLVPQDVFVLTKQTPSTVRANAQSSDKLRSEFRFEAGNFCLGASDMAAHGEIYCWPA